MVTVTVTVTVMVRTMPNTGRGRPARVGVEHLDRLSPAYRLPVVRIIVIMGVAIALAGIAVAITLSLYASRRDPTLAVQVWPYNSLAHGVLADRLAATVTDRTVLPAARQQAMASLAGQPGNPTAARVMGVVAGVAGDQAGLARWLDYSERYSRRDLAVQLAQIERAVEAGQIDIALVHYDRALRVFSPQPGLLDVLVSATATPDVRVHLIPMLQRRPPWRSSFLIQLVESHHAPAEAVYVMLRSLKLDPADPFERRILAEAVALLVSEGRVPLATTLIAAKPNEGLRNGRFDGNNFYPPLDWDLANGTDLSGVIEQGVRERGGNALFLDSRNDAAGVVAKQTMLLPPGRYTLSLVAGDGARTMLDAPMLTIGCAGRDGILIRLALLADGSPRTLHSPPFKVPEGCGVQTLVISVTGSSNTGGARPWIDDVAIRKLP